MKRFTWIPIIASVVLLLIALPLFASDIVSTVQPETKAAVDTFLLDSLTDQNVMGDEFGQGGSACESDAETNPF